MKFVYWFFTAAACVTIALLVAVIVILTVDSSDDDNPSTNIGRTVRFNNGREYPIFGIGTAYTSLAEARESAMWAIDRGYRHIDTAYIYGTEVGVGEAVNAKIAQGVIAREDIFITSKLWKEFMEPQLVRSGLEITLSRLNLSHVDLYLIHWPMNSPESFAFDYLDTWRAMEELVDEGLIRSIGVSNFNGTQLDHIIDNARIKPVVNQIESHPHCLNKRIKEHCRSRDVIVTAYSPLGTPGHPQFSPGDRLAINEPIIRAVAQKHQKTPAQIMIRYQIQNGHIAIVKTNRNDRVITNFDVFDFNLSAEDVTEIESVDYFYRTSNEDSDIGHHQFPFETFECL
ncbi:1,5-anhydro-D-fructose reductase-like [Bradysia coprophila]|uniref:1,5-anhydro-D-fructose reductase-like n=1 Tax=Bradysia coprophila TaxID=38358 RepID=UPI00187D910A|nr:1,5-anhydro-D-fructose reductase-like [Bradysia coprophila]